MKDKHVTNTFNVNNEVWRTIEEFDQYKVSNLGRIKSFKRKKPLILKTWIDKEGYAKVRLYYSTCDSSGKYLLVHRLVGLAFLPNPENKPCINHLNGNNKQILPNGEVLILPKDNRVSNLEWVTWSENEIHAFKNGLMELARKKSKERCGENSPSARLTQEQAADIKYGGSSYQEYIRKYRIGKTQIWKIKSGKAWKHLNHINNIPITYPGVK